MARPCSFSLPGPPSHPPGGLVEGQGDAAEAVVQPLGGDIGRVALGEGIAGIGRAPGEHRVLVVDAANGALAAVGLRISEVTGHPAEAGEAGVVWVLQGG